MTQARNANIVPLGISMSATVLTFVAIDRLPIVKSKRNLNKHSHRVGIGRWIMGKFFTVSVIFCLFTWMAGFAQTSNSTLGGTVADTSGALIPGVTVTASNAET